MTQGMRVMVATLLGAFLSAGAACAAGLTVSEARPGTVKGGAQILRCDVQWEASWRNDLPGKGRSGPGNHDAAWVFAKYQAGDGPWKPATLSAKAGDHVVPAGVGLSVGQTAGKGVGVFIYRSDNGMGSFSAKDLGLRWLRAADQVPEGVKVSVRVFALEMVHVPQGSFWVGDGLKDMAQFHAGGGGSNPFKVTSEAEIAIGPAAGNLYYDALDQWSGDQAGVLSAAFPKGYAAFYGMKYELTQGQYVDYLNTLTATQADVRWNAWWESIIKHGLWPTRACGIKKEGGVNRADMPLKACGFLRWADQAAYLDWAGLRPMTELEYEKACRGPLTPVAGEFAWGDVEFVEVDGLINEGTPDERPANFAKANLAADRCQLMRVGCLGLETGSRRLMGAGYYGMTELSGNQVEPVISAGSVKGRAFTGLHGDGALNEEGYADVTNWPGTDARGAGWRGGSVSGRRSAALGGKGDTDGHIMYGVRGVRTAPGSAGEAAASGSSSAGGRREKAGVGKEPKPDVDGVLNSEDKQILVMPKGKRVRVSGLTAKGGAAAPGTTVSSSWDDEALTVVFECADTNLVSKWAEERDSEKTWKDDSVSVLLDIGHHHGEGDNFVMFKLAAAGGLQDCRGKFRNIAFSVPDATAKVEFPPVALDAWQIMPPTAEQQKDALSTVPAGHWRGTIRIPWKGLGVKPADGEVWGVNFTRIEQPGMNFMAWAPFDGQYEELRSFGHLVFAPSDAPADAAAVKALRESIRQAHDRLVPVYCNENVSASISRGKPAVMGNFGVIPSGAPSRQATTATLTWGNDGLGVVFDCTDDGVVGTQEGRDNIKLWKDDSVYLFLDTGHTHGADRCWMIQVSASGAYLDHRNSDPKVDIPGATVRTERTGQGWRASVSVPWQGLGAGAPKAGDIWGLNLVRRDQPGQGGGQKMEMSSWGPLPEGDLDMFDRWGHLVFAGEESGAERDAATRSIRAVHDGRWRQAGPKPVQ